MSGWGEVVLVRRGFWGTAASCFFLLSQKASKSSGTGILGWMVSGEMAAPPSAETFKPEEETMEILQDKNPGSSSLPSMRKDPSSESVDFPSANGGRPSLESCQSATVARKESESGLKRKVTVSPGWYHASGRSVWERIFGVSTLAAGLVSGVDAEAARGARRRREERTRGCITRGGRNVGGDSVVIVRRVRLLFSSR